jgi:hypothetical protein
MFCTNGFGGGSAKVQFGHVWRLARSTVATSATGQDGAAVRAAFTAAGVAIEEPAGSEAHRIGRTDWRESDTLR